MLNDRGWEKFAIIANMAARDQSRPLASVNETSLLGSASLDFVRSGPSNMQDCCTFPFALSGLFLLSYTLHHCHLEQCFVVTFILKRQLVIEVL